MIRLSFLGIFVSISLLAAPGQVSAEVWKETLAPPPKNLTDMQKKEWQIGNFAGWLRLCDYHSKASKIISFMKISPYFRKGVSQYAKYDMSMSCGGFDEDLKYILGQKEQWEQYLGSTYSTFKVLPQPHSQPTRAATSKADTDSASAGATAEPAQALATRPDTQPNGARREEKPAIPVIYSGGLWIGTGTSESGTCRASTRKYGRLRSINVELIIRELEITGRVTKAYHGSSPMRVDASIRGIASESGEFNLQFGESILGAEFVLQGKLPKEGNRASGKWNTPNCRGTFSLTRKSPY